MTENRDIWVYVETDQGKIVKSSLELFTPALEMTGKTGGQVTAVILGSNIEEAAKTLGQYGAGKVIAARTGEYCPEAYTAAMAQLINKYKPDAVMFSATANAKDFVSKLACRIKTGVTANCTELSIDPETGLISWMMPAPGGIVATILCEKTRPQMGTVCRGIFKAPVPDESREAEVIFEDTDAVPSTQIRRLAKEIIKAEKSIEDAEIIVAGGYGARPEGFVLLEQLADALGGVVAASRAAVDADWIAADRMVGQSGKVVHPKLYIACGISGALQHIVGVAADCVVAINNDPRAPIFEIADYGIVGSIFDVVPALIEEVRKAKG